MSNTIQNRLASLKQYVHGIRFLDSFPVVDVILKENWLIPKSSSIVNAEVDKSINHYIFTSEKEGIDEILDFVEYTVNLNLDKEKKQILFKEKVKELQEFFKKHKLVQLVNLKFTLKENDLIDEELENDIHEDLNEIKLEEIKSNTELVEEVKIPVVIENNEQLKETFGEKPLFKENMTEEEREEEEAIARAKAFRDNKDVFKLTGNNKVKTKHGQIELPSKNIKVCECGDDLDKICGICADRKSL